MCCFHPRALEDLHKRGVEVAVTQFLANRPESEADEYREAVVKASSIDVCDGFIYIKTVSDTDYGS